MNVLYVTSTKERKSDVLASENIIQDKHENLQDSLYSVCNSGILFSGRNR